MKMTVCFAPHGTTMAKACGLLLLGLSFLLSPATVVHASGVACTSSPQCEDILRRGSQCIDGKCTNPLYHGGCLKSLVPSWNKTRICNSQDPPEAELLGYCRPSPMDYAEIRIAARDWESAVFGGWVLQILLSEILDVPTSIEGGSPDCSPTRGTAIMRAVPKRCARWPRRSEK